MLARIRKTTLLGAAAISAFAAFAVFQGCSDGAPPGGTTKVVVTTAAITASPPIDATPDAKNENIFYLAQGEKGVAVFKVAVKGGEPAEIFSGDPLVDPRGIAFDAAGNKVFIADRAAEGGKGAIYAMSVDGGMPVLVNGTEGTHPVALDVAEVRGATKVFFTGTTHRGRPAVFSLPIEGGVAALLASGEPFGKPTGVAAAMDGTLYVTDEAPPSGGQGAVFQISEGKVTSVANGFVAGHPAGTALMLDESALLVSSLDESQGSAQVLIIDLKTAKTTTFSDVIGAEHMAGGLHRALTVNDFAHGTSKPLYSLGFKRIQFEGSTPGGPSN